jgi:hypothetical protein
MGSRWLARSAAFAAAGVGVFAFASPAMADSNVNINPGNLNDGKGTTAAAVKDQHCDADKGAGPYADEDVWVFVLPGGGTFQHVHLTFSTPGGDVSKNITADQPSGIGSPSGNANSFAWIRTPAGWTLTAASAMVADPEKDFFNLTHTCPATGGGESPSPEASPSEETQESPTPGESEGTQPSPSASTPGLPVTGTAVAGIVTTGVLLVGVGVGLVLMHRRRSLTDAAE